MSKEKYKYVILDMENGEVFTEYTTEEEAIADAKEMVVTKKIPLAVLKKQAIVTPILTAEIELVGTE